MNPSDGTAPRFNRYLQPHVSSLSTQPLGLSKVEDDNLANIADMPSRGDFALLNELGSERFEITLPEVGGDWQQVYQRIFRDLAPRPSASVKRARKEVDSEVRRLRGRSN